MLDEVVYKTSKYQPLIIHGPNLANHVLVFREKNKKKF